MPINVSSCIAYLQLFASWLMLNLSTLSLGLVTESAKFFGLTDTINDASDNIVVFGLWVLSEIGLFFVLLILATAVMCSCKSIPSGAGFIHLLVDPTLVTLGCIPFLLIKGLPTANSLYVCLHGRQNLSDPATNPCTAAELNSFNNLTAIVSSTRGQAQLERKMEHWVGCLQCMLLVPVILRMLRYRWKMPWIPFLLSELYLFIQATEIALLIQTGAQYTQDQSLQLAIEALVYISTLYICVASLAMATPPSFVGNQVTNDYLKASLIIGTLVVDIPFLIARLALVAKHPYGTTAVRDLNPLTYVLMMKDVVSGGALVCYAVRSSACVQTQYLSLSSTDVEEEDEFDDEDFV